MEAAVAETRRLDTPRAARRVIANVRLAVSGGRRLELAVVALLAEGHVLVEDVPRRRQDDAGKALARSLDCSFAACSSHRTCCRPTSPA